MRKRNKRKQPHQQPQVDRPRLTQRVDMTEKEISEKVENKIKKMQKQQINIYLALNRPILSQWIQAQDLDITGRARDMTVDLETDIDPETGLDQKTDEIGARVIDQTEAHQGQTKTIMKGKDRAVMTKRKVITEKDHPTMIGKSQTSMTTKSHTNMTIKSHMTTKTGRKVVLIRKKFMKIIKNFPTKDTAQMVN